MVSLDNLHNIFMHRALLSKEQLTLKDVRFTSIANDEVQQMRSRIFVWDASNGVYRSLHSFVPFYFATHTPMLYKQYKDGLQDSMVILGVNRAILTNSGILFTNGNASMQQLTNSGNQKVYIIPMTSQNMSCHRLYRPQNIPLGGNSDHSDFYSDITLLDQLNWDIINDRDFTVPQKKRIKHAETLIPDKLSLKQIEEISVNSLDMMRAVNRLIETQRLIGRIPNAEYRSRLFF